jgi:hypothetical protein
MLPATRLYYQTFYMKHCDMRAETKIVELVDTTVAMERPINTFLRQRTRDAKIEESLERVFSSWSARGYITRSWCPAAYQPEWEWDWAQAQSLPSSGEWPVLVRPLLSSKKRPHFKTCKILKRIKIWSWVPTEPVTNDCAAEGQQECAGLDWVAAVESL